MKLRNTKLDQRRISGFTLVELLAAMGVVAILVALCVGAVSRTTEKGKMASEINAGRNLYTAYQTYAAENNGTYLPGMDNTVSKVWFEPYGRDITMMHAANRYPFRLAPYFDYSLKGTIFVNDNAKQIAKMATPGTTMHDYVVSAFPTFGINYNFVGGLLNKTPNGPEMSFKDDCVTRIGASDKNILLFASGGTTDGSQRVDGYNILTPPYIYASNWSAQPWKKGEDPGEHGNVDARYEGRAVCVFLDGSVQMKSIEELRDMRLWNRNAAQNSDPSYTVSVQP